MKIFQALACVLALDCIIVYLFQNAFSGVSAASASGASSVAFGWLALAVLFGAGAMSIRILRAEHVGVCKSAVLLLAFLVYFAINLSVNMVDSSDIVSYTISTSGGIIFSYLLGFICAVCLQGILELRPQRAAARFFVSLALFSFVCLLVLLLALGYQEAAGNLRAAHLIVSDTSGYQRSGNFLSMIFLLASVAVVGMVFFNKRRGRLENKTLTIAALIFYIIAVPLVMYEGQLLGSNSVVLFVTAICVPTVAFAFFGLRGRAEKGKRVTLFRVAMFGGATIFLLLVLALTAISYFNIDVTNLRLFNFGEGGATPTSISSRLSIIERDYLEQLNYAPVFGNMAVDTLTSGSGSYAHSLPLSLLTHVGLVGFILFSAFIFVRVRELRRSNSWCGVIVGSEVRKRNFLLFILLAMFAVVLIASLTAFFVWMPLWFALGLLVPPVVFRARRTEDISSSARADSEPSKILEAIHTHP